MLCTLGCGVLQWLGLIQMLLAGRAHRRKLEEQELRQESSLEDDLAAPLLRSTRVEG